MSVQPSDFRELGTILVNAPLQSRSDTEEWLKDNGFRYSSDKKEQITVYPDTEGEFSLRFSEYDGTVHTELFVRNTEEMYEYVKKKIQLSAGKGDIDIFTEHPNERSDENWWWVLNDRILRISFISEDKLILISIEINKSQLGDKDITEFETADESFADNRKTLVKKGFLIAGALIALFFGCLLGAAVKDRLEEDKMEYTEQESDTSHWVEDNGKLSGIDEKLLIELPLNEGPDEVAKWLDDHEYTYERSDHSEGVFFTFYDDDGYKAADIYSEEPDTLGKSYYGTITFRHIDSPEEIVREEFARMFQMQSEGIGEAYYSDGENVYEIFYEDVSRYTLCDINLDDIVSDVTSAIDILLNCPKASTEGYTDKLPEGLIETWLDQNGYSNYNANNGIDVEFKYFELDIGPLDGSIAWEIRAKNSGDLYEAIKKMISEETYAEFDQYEWEKTYDEYGAFDVGDVTIHLRLDKTLGEIYISADKSI